MGGISGGVWIWSLACSHGVSRPPALCGVNLYEPEGYIDSTDYPPLPRNHFLECTYNVTVYTGYGVELQVGRLGGAAAKWCGGGTHLLPRHNSHTLHFSEISPGLGFLSPLQGLNGLCEAGQGSERPLCTHSTADSPPPPPHSSGPPVRTLC